jgi:hypothetical protein
MQLNIKSCPNSIMQLLWPHLLWHQQASATHQLLPIKTTTITMGIIIRIKNKSRTTKVINGDTIKPTKKHLKQYKYYNHTPVYCQTIRRPLVVASLWRAPRTVIVNPNYFQFSGPRIDVGYSFSL